MLTETFAICSQAVSAASYMRRFHYGSHEITHTLIQVIAVECVTAFDFMSAPGETYV
jgi:hypothetical protein